MSDKTTAADSSRADATSRAGRVADDDDNIVLDPQDDDWAWRRKIRAHPFWGRFYRVAVGVLGAIVVVVGLILVPFPGPGWLIVFFGVGIWASEFEQAQRLLHWGRGVLATWTSWMGRQNWVVQGLVGLATLLVLLAVFWGLLAISGVPGWLPDHVEDLVRRVPGLGA